MKKLLLSIALSLSLTGGAFAQGAGLSLVTTPPTNSAIELLNTGSPLNVGITADDFAEWVAANLDANVAIIGTLTITSSNASALAVGRQGATAPALKVDASASSSATGMEIVSAAAAGGVNLRAISSGTDENLAINAKGAGTITLNGTGTGNIVLGQKTTLTATSASTDGATSVQPFVMSSTMTGVGGVGGRAYFGLTTNVALGGWSNALKGEVIYGASGRTTGLGSAILAEMQLSAGTSSGSYAPLEIELGMGSGALTGTRTSFASINVYGAAASTMDTSGYLFDLNGLTAGAGKLFDTTSKTGIGLSGALKIKIGSTDYFIPICTTAACGGS